MSQINMGEVEFSPELSNKSIQWHVWKQMKRFKNSGRIDKDKLKRSDDQCGLQNIFKVEWLDILREEKKAREAYEESKKVAKQLRQEHLKKCGEDAEEGRQMKAIQRIINREKDRNEWRKMTQVFGKDRLSAIKEVETWDGYQWNWKCTQDEVEIGIMDEIEKRFRLT